MRSRNIKPGFFRNEDLGLMDPITRIVFIGLWCAADRDGRIEDRPLRLKADILPYESRDINGDITVLQRRGFVIRYEVDGKRFLLVKNFKLHQNPHHTEAKSKLPDISDGCIITVDSPLNTGKYPADSLIPDSLIPDSKTSSSSSDDAFAKFWSIYPRKVGKGDVEKAWKKINKPAETVGLIEAALLWQKKSEQWNKDNGAFIPHPSTYLNQRRWEDEEEPVFVEDQLVDNKKRDQIRAALPVED